MPNFFIVGAAKSGTTSLYNYLMQHPQIFLPAFKEPHFFSLINPINNGLCSIEHINTIEEYENIYSGSENYAAIGDASPSYLSEIGTSVRIKHAVPHAKIIILIRNPVIRAYSHYLMDVRDGFQKLSFYDAIHKDFTATDKGWGVSHMYVELGMYYEQVKSYIDVFGSKMVKVILFDDFAHRTSDVLCEVFDFLEVNKYSVDTTRIYNKYSLPKYKFVPRMLRYAPVTLIRKYIDSEIINRAFKVLLYSNDIKKTVMDNQSFEFLNNIYCHDLKRLANLLGYDCELKC